MKVGILGQAGGWHSTALEEALARRGIAARTFPITRFTARVSARPHLSVCGEALDDYDVLFVRAIPGGSLEQIVFRLDALHRLEDNGVRVVNPSIAIERGVDKYYTSALLEEAGLPTPRTVAVERFEEAMAAFDSLGNDVVVKPLFGSEGRGMVRVSDTDTAYRVFRALELGRYVYYVQEFVPHGCEDIRTFVVGERVVAAMVRRGAGWKTNVAQGATAERLELDDRLVELSVRATRSLGADYAGVDILPVEGGGYVVLEVNSIPGWRALRSVTDVDAAEHLLDYVLDGSG